VKLAMEIEKKEKKKNFNFKLTKMGQNFKYEEKDNFGFFCPSQSLARHVVIFPSRITGRPNEVANFKGVSSLEAKL